MIHRAARSRSAVSSTTTGGFPGPPAMRRLPVWVAKATTPWPPVTAINLILGCVISAWADGTDGSSKQHTQFSGPPAAAIAWFRSRITRAETILVFGCGLLTTVLPPASIIIALNRIVGAPLVTGFTEAITPTGMRSMMVMPLSPLNTSGTRSSIPMTWQAA